MNQAMTIEDCERGAYIKGDTTTANLLARISELESEVSRLTYELGDTYSLEEWSLENGSADEYKDFFYTCFSMLDGKYPAPSINNEHDKQVIYDAIRKGENL